MTKGQENQSAKPAAQQAPAHQQPPAQPTQAYQPPPMPAEPNYPPPPAQIQRGGEVSAIAQAEMEKAAVQARYMVALSRPRDWDTVRARLLKECHRPGFAEVARYRKPIGQGVEGLSIRFVEAALRCVTNVLVESHVIFDDEEKRQIRVSVTDLESNITYPTDIMIAKTVERSKVPQGETPLAVRTGSKGQTVYILRATEDDLLNKQNAQVSKAIRTNGLRIIPGDIQDEAENVVLDTLRNRAAQDPDAEKKRVIDAFARLNIYPDALKDYIGHPVEQLNAKEILELRALYTAIKDGEATWAAAMEVKNKSREIRPPQEKQPTTGSAGGTGGTQAQPEGANGAN